MATAALRRRRSRRLADGAPAGGERLVVQSDHERAELADVHEVAADDVDLARLPARPLLARPAEQRRESPQGHPPHALEGVEEDVGGVFRQVQAGDVETSWTANR